MQMFFFLMDSSVKWMACTANTVHTVHTVQTVTNRQTNRQASKQTDTQTYPNHNVMTVTCGDTVNRIQSNQF